MSFSVYTNHFRILSGTVSHKFLLRRQQNLAQLQNLNMSYTVQSAEQTDMNIFTSNSDIAHLKCYFLNPLLMFRCVISRKI